jgi:hypothetical protein
MEDLLINLFYSKAEKENFEIIGLLTSEKKVLTLGSDSKLIGRIFELVCVDMLKNICKTFGWVLEESQSQTVYPDYTINMPNGKRMAIDIKTTYRRYNTKCEVLPFGFTLGSYNSFLRNGTKNIAHPYNEYIKHYVIGFVYDRVDNAVEGLVLDPQESIRIFPPYKNIEYFMQEKFKIAGDKPGSGNTENIGTFKSASILDFKEGKGVFSETGNVDFEQYWRGYPKYRASVKNYTTYKQYIDYLKINN